MLGGALLVSLSGWLASRSVINTPPVTTLRAGSRKRFTARMFHRVDMRKLLPIAVVLMLVGCGTITNQYAALPKVRP
jgi:hypothetical protein